MKLPNIKKELENNGYAVSYRPGDDFIVAGIKGEGDNFLGINVMSKAFFILAGDNKIKMRYPYYQFEKEKIFDTLPELMAFVKKEYPIN